MFVVARILFHNEVLPDDLTLAPHPRQWSRSGKLHSLEIEFLCELISGKRAIPKCVCWVCVFGWDVRPAVAGKKCHARSCCVSFDPFAQVDCVDSQADDLPSSSCKRDRETGDAGDGNEVQGPVGVRSSPLRMSLA